MAVKTITVTESAYNTLKNMKLEHESFSKTIQRIGQRRSLRDFIGVFSDEEAEEIKQNITEFRARHRHDFEKRIEKTKRLTRGHS